MLTTPLSTRLFNTWYMYLGLYRSFTSNIRTKLQLVVQHYHKAQVQVRAPSKMKLINYIFLAFSLGSTESFSPQAPQKASSTNELQSSSNRRNFLSKITSAGAAVTVLSMPQIANAGIDPSALKTYQIEGDINGAATRLKQIQEEKVRPDDTIDIPFTELPSGVSYREYREGKGEAVVQPGSKVAVEMTIRCKSFATANDPGGLKYYSTKVDTDFNEAAWTVGSGELLPGLEEGMMGMHKNAIRRIEVPSTMVFAARNNGQLPLPKETNKDGKRLFDRLFKTEATLLFEVLVTRIK